MGQSGRQWSTFESTWRCVLPITQQFTISVLLIWCNQYQDYNTATFPHEKYYDIEKYEMSKYHKKQRKAAQDGAAAVSDQLGAIADEERLRMERKAAREAKEQEDFKLVLQMMDKDKIDNMRHQEELRAQMQMHYRSGNVTEARRLEQLLNREDDK